MHKNACFIVCMVVLYVRFWFHLQIYMEMPYIFSQTHNTINGKWVEIVRTPRARVSQCKLNGGESIEMALSVWNWFRLFWMKSFHLYILPDWLEQAHLEGGTNRSIRRLGFFLHLYTKSVVLNYIKRKCRVLFFFFAFVNHLNVTHFCYIPIVTRTILFVFKVNGIFLSVKCPNFVCLLCFSFEFIYMEMFMQNFIFNFVTIVCVFV